MYFFHPFARLGIGAKLQRDTLTALGGEHSGRFLHIHRGPSPEINHRMEVAEMKRGVQRLNEASRGMNLNLHLFPPPLLLPELSFLNLPQCTGALRSSAARFNMQDESPIK